MINIIFLRNWKLKLIDWSLKSKIVKISSIDILKFNRHWKLSKRNILIEIKCLKISLGDAIIK